VAAAVVWLAQGRIERALAALAVAAIAASFGARTALFGRRWPSGQRSGFRKGFARSAA
jgi:peroxiredoxin family protein